MQPSNKRGLALIWAGLTCVLTVVGTAAPAREGDSRTTVSASSSEQYRPLVVGATQIAVNGDWGTYVYTDEQGSDVCYAMTVSSGFDPAAGGDRRVYFAAGLAQGHRPGYETYFMTTYDMRKDAMVIVGTRTFAMMVVGNYAWTAHTSEDPALLAAMKGARRVIVSATSAGGVETDYLFSLRGFDAALDSIATCTDKLLSDAGRRHRPAAA
jgi:hypothetical protein